MHRRDRSMLVPGSGTGWVSGRKLRRVGGGLGLLAASVLAAAAPGVVSAGSAAPVLGGAAGANCVPEILVLPAHTETAGATVSAINDAGLVAGTSYDFDEDVGSRVVVWHAMEPPTDTGIGGTAREDGSQVFGDAVDVNEAGVVAARRYGYTARGRLRTQMAILWDQDAGKARLPATAQRPKAEVSALNDHGVAVGSIRGNGKRPVPVYWRGGHVRRLPIPADASYGWSVDINNRGLIVGGVVMDRQSWPWWWRRDGRSGPLSVGNLKSNPNVVAVDDRDRVVGQRFLSFDRSRTFLWRGPSARPRHILGDFGGPAAMDDSGHLTGFYGGFRGIDDRAWVARLGDAGVASLPDPPMEDPSGWVANTKGQTVAKGVTAFAPQGGLTVGGYAQPDGEPLRAVLWTCAQTYLE